MKRKAALKKNQNGRERPHFFGFQPPKKFVGSLPPGTLVACSTLAARRKNKKRFVLRAPLQLLDELENDVWRSQGNDETTDRRHI